MQREIKKYILLIAGFAVTFTAAAQSFRAAYFLEGVTTRHRLNPALMSEQNYISIPGLGNTGAGAQGNIGLTDFIYKYDDPTGKYDLTTFMSSTVGREQFLSKLHDINRINVHSEITILGTGFHKWGGFNTIELTLRSNSNTNLPYELFDFMKSGMDQTEGAAYQIRDVRSISEAYAELAFGHARKISEKVAVGAKAKLLLGGGYLDGHISQLDVTMGQEQWKVEANGTILGSVDGGKFKTENDGKGNHIKGIDVDSPGPSGWGLAADMGLDYKLTHDLTLSAALTDLGFITWDKVLRGATLNEPYYFDGFESIDLDDKEESDKDFDEQLKELGDDLGDLAKFYEQNETSGKTTMIAANLRLGAEYRMPFYRRLSAGFLWTTRFHELHTWTEGRLYANMSPSKWFDFSVNYGLSNLASSMGWILNFHPGGVNFFIGSDQMVLKVNSQGVPLNKLNAGILMGVNITFGERH